VSGGKGRRNTAGSVERIQETKEDGDAHSRDSPEKQANRHAAAHDQHYQVVETKYITLAKARS